MKQLRFILALFCAEWLLIFRAWLAPSILSLLILTAGIRLLALGLTPSWMGAQVVFIFAGFSLLIRLRRFLSGRGTGRNRAMYETPDTGVPWLTFLTTNPKAAFFLESVIALCVVGYYFPLTPLQLPPDSFKNPELFATLSAFLGVFALSLWNGVHSRVPKVENIQDRGLSFKPVRQQSHRKVQLPSVKELADAFQRES